MSTSRSDPKLKSLSGAALRTNSLNWRLAALAMSSAQVTLVNRGLRDIARARFISLATVRTCPRTWASRFLYVSADALRLRAEI